MTGGQARRCRGGAVHVWSGVVAIAQQHRTMMWTALAGAFCALLVLGVTVLLLADQSLAKEALAGVIGVVTTPFFLEATVFFLGMSLVAVWNAWRLRKEGDGWVYLAEAEDRKLAGRHDAVFVTPPGPEPDDLACAEIEGLLALGAWADAGEKLLELPGAQYDSPRGLECRLTLAIGLGHQAEAEQLRARLGELRRGTEA